MHPLYRQYSEQDKALIREYLTLSTTSPSGLVWRKRPAQCVQAGATAGSAGRGGYWHVLLKGRRLAVHRVAWLLSYGEDPYPLTVDHIDRDRANNQPRNLRLADESLQKRNRAYFQRDCKTSAPYKWIKKQASGNWLGQFGYLGKKYFTRTVETPEEAYRLVCELRSSMNLPV